MSCIAIKLGASMCEQNVNVYLQAFLCFFAMVNWPLCERDGEKILHNANTHIIWLSNIHQHIETGE